MSDPTPTQETPCCQNQAIPKGGEGCCCANFFPTDSSLAFLVLRGWLGVRALLTGIEKFSSFKIVQKPLIDTATGMVDPSGAMVDVKQKIYGLANYSAIPSSLKDKFALEPLLELSASARVLKSCASFWVELVCVDWTAAVFAVATDETLAIDIGDS